jgi:hypothetical protein
VATKVPGPPLPRAARTALDVASCGIMKFSRVMLPLCWNASSGAAGGPPA